MTTEIDKAVGIHLLELTKGIQINLLENEYVEPPICELAKHIITVGSKLATDVMRYLAVLVRGWPDELEDTRSSRKEPRQ